MTSINQTSTRSKDEIRVFAPWAYYLFTSILLIATVLIVVLAGRDHDAPRLVIRCLVGVLAGTVLGCYAVLIGYINQDSGRRGMSRVLWTLMAIFVPNGLGIVLYFVLRKPLTVHCPQCDAEVEPGFSFCPRCQNRLQPTCPHCQRRVDPNNKFCPYCGKALDQAAGVASAMTTSQP